MKKKGQLSELQALVVPLVGIGIVLVIGFLIFAEVRTNTSLDSANAETCSSGDENGTYACNGTLEVIEAMEDVPGWLPIIVIVVIGAILLSLVAMFSGKR